MVSVFPVCSCTSTSSRIQPVIGQLPDDHKEANFDHPFHPYTCLLILPDSKVINFSGLSLDLHEPFTLQRSFN